MQQEIQSQGADVKSGLEQLQALRDEVRLKVHLASMDIKDEWEKVEEEARALEVAARSAGRVSLDAVSDLGKRLRSIRDLLV
jgi:hypothetical protein